MQHNWLRRQRLPNQSHNRKHDILDSTLLVGLILLDFTLHVPCFETFLLLVYILSGNLKCWATHTFDDSNLYTEGILYVGKRCRQQVYQSNIGNVLVIIYKECLILWILMRLCSHQDDPDAYLFLLFYFKDCDWSHPNRVKRWKTQR